MAQAGLVTDAVDSFAFVLGWVFLVWSVAKRVAGAVSICSAISSFTVVIDADTLGTTLRVLVASNSVASVLEVIARILVVTSPGVLAILASAISAGSALDGDAFLIVALVLRRTLRV